MSEFPHHIIPVPQAEIEEVFAVHHTTHAFYQEVRSRQVWEAHCDWYAEVAAQNRRDYEKMQSEVNIMGWFYGWKRNA